LINYDFKSSKAYSLTSFNS